ncbi:hypothetical protein V8F06_002602 [Rhypophila decipiens]
MTTAIGPLTTVFKAPSSCTTNTPQIYQVHSTGDSYSYVQGPLYESGSDCYPSGYEPAPSAYYSPGSSCPHGYTAACSNVATVGTVVVETETALICCPTATGIIAYTCAGADNKAPSLGCQMAFSRAKGVIGATVVNKDGSVGSYGVFTESEGLFAAHSIQIRFRSADNSGGIGLLDVPQTTSTSSSSTAASVNTDAQRTTVATFSIPVQTSGSTETQPEAKAESGVSTGAAIGIAIGSAIAGILIVSIIGLFFFLRWRRKRHPPPVPPKERSASFPNHHHHHQPMGNNGTSIQPGPYELSEEPASRRSRPSQSRRLRMMLSSRSSSSRRTTTRPSTRGRSGVPPIPQLQSDPAELEAVVPSSDGSNLSFKSDNRSTPETMSTSGWSSTLGQHQRDGVTPMPWI